MSEHAIYVLLSLQSWPKKVCPRLRDSACWRSGEITQPRTNFFGQLCISLYILCLNSVFLRVNGCLGILPHTGESISTAFAAMRRNNSMGEERTGIFGVIKSDLLGMLQFVYREEI